MRKLTGTDHNESESSTIVGLSFEDPYRAQEFQVAAVGMVAKHDLELLDVVTIVKDHDDRTRVIESIDPTPGQSAISGGMWAGLFGLLLGGPIGFAAGAAFGAGVGAVTAKVVDLGLPDAWVAWFREAVRPGTTTVVLLLDSPNVETVLSELERFTGARLVYANVPPDVIDRIRTAIDDPSTGPLTGETTGGAESAARDGSPETAPGSPTAD